MKMGRSKAFMLALFALALSACLSTKTQTLAPNMVRLNLVEEYAPTEQEALQSVLVRGAQETVSRGYDLFRFIDWSAGPQRMPTPGQAPAANFSVTVVMFHRGEQGQNPTFDANQILQGLKPLK